MTRAMVAMVGNPNTGKSTLFNALTGANAKVGNFAGTTVDKLERTVSLGGRTVRAVDVPGCYSLAAHSPEERVAIELVLGLGDDPPPDALVVLVDATRLVRSLYLVLQLLELEVPMVVALNFMDEARQTGRVPDPAAMAATLGVPVVPVVARTEEGLDALRTELLHVLDHPEAARPGPRHGWPDAVLADADQVLAALPPRWAARGRPVALWAMLSMDDEQALQGTDLPRETLLAVARRAREAGRDPTAELVGARYRWLDEHVSSFLAHDPVGVEATRSEGVDAVLLHPVWGSLVFLTVMSTLFMALFAWADPLIGMVEEAFAALGGWVGGGFAMAVAAGWPVGLLGEFVVDGLIGGVGSVLVFLPQIALLFLFIALLEDSGYLARAAHLMDRILRLAGLPGTAFVPLLSGYACAVPAIMATRALPRARDRLLTMMVIPLTTCSARLPVYTLLIATLFPERLGDTALPLQPLMMLGMYLFATLTSVLAAIALGKLVVPASTDAALIELVPYRVPSPKVVLGSTWRNAKHFVQEAGGVILVATVLLWGLLSFPRYDPAELLPPAEQAAVEAAGGDVEAVRAGRALERSFGGRVGQAIEPVIAPLGFDWKIGVGILGAFAAREVFVSTMGLVYGIGDEVDEESDALRDRMRSDRRADGTPTYTPLVGLSLMVFFSLAMQCTSTLAVLVKETRSWRWPAFVLVYMSVLAWSGSFVVYQGGRLLGWGS